MISSNEPSLCCPQNIPSFFFFFFFFLFLLNLSQPINLANSEAKGRVLIREGLLTRLRLKNRRLAAEKAQGRKLEKLHIFYFNDIIVITKPFRSTPESKLSKI